VSPTTPHDSPFTLKEFLAFLIEIKGVAATPKIVCFVHVHQLPINKIQTRKSI
jgi:hypothetical protein